ncbi:MAG: hypothetical protein C4K48_03660 [Candidatus Thorarchaeota archaeon]|nr:MAG: hypothetical protein C4K48_03660 [Candidatus Thorarchaeota archaeon]
MWVSETEECVRAVADEILRGHVLRLDEPLSYPGIAIIPIIRVQEQKQSKRFMHIPRSTLREDAHKVIVGSIPMNSCGVLILDSLGDVITFKLHQEVSAFWERINFVEKIVAENYRDTRKPLSRASATARVVAFLMRLRNDGTEAVVTERTNYFVVSLTDAAKQAGTIQNYLESTAAILYSSASR